MASVEKSVVVRVKRRRIQEPLDAFLLEINERPLKKPLLDFGKLSISDSCSFSTQLDDGVQTVSSKKVFVQRIETVSNLDVTKDVLESFLIGSADPQSTFQKKIKERKDVLLSDIDNQSLRQKMTRQHHEAFGKSVHFEQIKKNKCDVHQPDVKLHERFNLYDVARVDSEDEVPNKVQQEMGVDNNDADADVQLSKFIPLLRDFDSTVASEIESDLLSRHIIEEDCVYDIYTVEEEIDDDNKSNFADYTLVQVDETDDLMDDDFCESEYDSEDSNAENYFLNDYPEEDSSDSEYRDENSEDEDENSEDEDENSDEEDVDEEDDMEFVIVNSLDHLEGKR
ncbi:hypothetical protein ZOSMA_373G00030 [Zostera marina]|uniref:Transcription factor Iwr1 domain-containing protein n=1 Tax=Zostera marina TaxID=29655 RepID=A0A0K9P846_ZOSMR|nr:hypothetical protein ZOSMA_373G00030 [Zostera marina]